MAYPLTCPPRCKRCGSKDTVWDDVGESHAICNGCMIEWEVSVKFQAFVGRCYRSGVTLTDKQVEVAEEVFSALEKLGVGEGRTTLIDLLKRFDR